MIPPLRLAHAKQTIIIEQEAFAGGGEGNLHRIRSPKAWTGFVVKLYFPHKLTRQREEKIHYLIANPPHQLIQAHDTEASVVWIADAVYTDTPEQKFVGLVMPFVQGEKLEVLCLGKLPQHLGSEWQRFDFKNKDASALRFRLCFNLAAAIYQVHSSDRYVVVDLKPENVIVRPNGLVSLVDMDSVEVLDPSGKAVYPAPVATPEYTPPEYYSHQRTEGETVGEQWDRFGLSVILYKLLLGIHPYTASNKAPFDQLAGLHEKIAKGLFVFAPSQQAYMGVVPPPHSRWVSLPTSLQALFIQCFEQGHSAPALRPTAEEWCVALLDTFGDELLKQQFGRLLFVHQQSSGFALPSSKVPIPAMPVAKTNWMPPELLKITTMEIPRLDSTAARQNVEQIYQKTYGLTQKFVLRALVVLLATALWAVSLWATGIVLIIGQVFLSLLFNGTLGEVFEDDPAGAFSRRKVYEEAFDEKRRVYIKASRQLQQLQERLIAFARQKFGNYEHFFQEASRRIQHLKTFLQAQDQIVIEWNKRCSDLILEQQTPFLEQLKNEPLLQKAKGKNLEALREWLEWEEQQFISRHKQKMQLISKDGTLAQQQYPLSVSLEAAWKAAKEAIEQRFVEATQELQQKINRRIADEQMQSDADVQALEQSVADKQYLSPANLSKYLLLESGETAAAVFLAAGIQSLSDIQSVNMATSQLVLNNGQVLQWDTLLAPLSASPITLAVLLSSWCEAVATEKTGLQQRLKAVSNLLAHNIQHLRQEEKTLLEELNTRKTKEIKGLELAIFDRHYQQMIQQETQAYQAVKQRLDQLLADYNAAYPSPPQAALAVQIENLQQQCEQEAESVRQFIENNKTATESQLMQANEDKTYRQLLQDFNASVNGIETAIQQYKQFEKDFLNGK